MRATLIFPPYTGPTYTPLGISCLAASAAAVPGAAVDLFDANLDLWNRVCDADAGLSAMREFSHGSLEIFLDPAVYCDNWAHYPQARRAIGELELQARRYLAGAGLESNLDAILKAQSMRILHNTPEVVGFSAMYIDQLPFLLAAAKYLRENYNKGFMIVAGGAAMSALPTDELLAVTPFIDAILIGEGEISFNALLGGTPVSALPGCYYRDGATIRFSGRPQSPAVLDDLPFPDFEQLMSGGYFNPVPVLPIYGCRGCKWRCCRFCTHNSSFGGHRARSPEVVVREMAERHDKFNCRHFYMVDQYVPPEYLDRLSDEIIASGLDCRFQIMARTVPEYTPQLLHKAAAAGCRWISWGMESGSQRLLDLMNKGTRVASSLEVIRNASAEGISNLLMMIFGAPGSDRESMEETFTFLEQAWDHIDAMTASAFVLFDQTAFGLHPERYGLEVIGENPVLTVNGRTICDRKLRFRRAGEFGRGESPLAAYEIDAWESRKAWLSPLSFRGRLCCEHYLLYSDCCLASPRPSSTGVSA
ncbi:MAG: radical SAM protein [Victivallaceae bacterium]|nr:radical SAM protein [Victivallaceae bacterium]